MSLVNHPVDLLLEAFAIVKQRCSDAALVLVGGGQDYDFLRQRAEELGLGETAFFAGRVKPEAVPHYLAMADVSVEPVHDDLTARARSPLKVFESLAVGTPVVTGDVGDRGNIFGDEQAGMLTKAGDAQGLAEGILTVLEDSDLARAMQQAALTLREKYYWDVLVRDFVQVYSL
jgi:glycosyltransferase involved in cell wall biosynthesis